MSKYRKRPVVVDAFQWFAGEDIIEGMEWGSDRMLPYIETLEGKMYVSPGDYVITGVKGELYPCKPDVFEASYERCE